MHCRHCYSDCFNRTSFLKKELKASQVKLIFDKLQDLGVIWLCLTGGDPLFRNDFPELYTYARKKGFIITIFTSGYSLNDKLVSCLKANPPFGIELTLNAVSQGLYERISRVKGSFAKVMHGIKLLRDANLPFKIKTHVTTDNFHHLNRIKMYLRKLGLKFYPSFILHPQINGNSAPCNLRISPNRVLDLIETNSKAPAEKKECAQQPVLGNSLYPCVITSGDGFYIDPYGNMFLCKLIRSPKLNLLNVSPRNGLIRLLSKVRSEFFESSSKCRSCKLKVACVWCPGKAMLETGNPEAPIDYYCRLAKITTEYAN